MRAEYINAFVDPAVIVIEKALKVDAIVGKITKGFSPSMEATYSVAIGVKGDLSGVVIVVFSNETARNVSNNMLNKSTHSLLSQEDKETLSELTNMIVGNAAGKLYELGLKESLTPPAVVAGTQSSFSTLDMSESIVVPINTKLGVIYINIFLKDKRSI